MTPETFMLAAVALLWIMALLDKPDRIARSAKAHR